MSEHRGYKGKSLEFLKKNNIKVRDTIKIFSDLTYEGILMPRYEQSDDQHIVLKLKSGYNIGLEIDGIKKIEILSSNQIKPESGSVKKESNPELPKKPKQPELQEKEPMPEYDMWKYYQPK